MGTKISGMDPAGALTGDELVEVVQDGTSVRTTTAAIAGLGEGGSSSVPWFDFVADFSADPTGATDCTSAWNSFISAAVAAGGGNLLADGQFKFSGAMQDSSRGNAQILLPSRNYITDAPISIGVFGPVQPPAIGSVIGSEPAPMTGVTRFISTTASGTGALLGGWGPSGSTAEFTNVHLTLRNLIFQTVDNPTITALDLSRCASVDVDGVLAFTGALGEGSITYPTTSTSYGLRAPALNNGANTILGTVHVMGFYNGFQIAEHACGINLVSWFCANAFEFDDAFHASMFLRAMAVHCTNVIVSAASTAHMTRIVQLDIEHATSGSFVPGYDVLDASSTIHGDLKWQVVQAGSGIDDTFTKSGGTHLATAQIGTPAGDVAGPATAVDGHLAVFDGTTGKLLKDGGAVPSGGLGSTVTALTISSGVVDVNCSLGDYFTLTLTANVTSLTFSSLPASGTGRTLSIQIKQDGTGARTFALPASFKAVTGSDTAVQAAANAVTKLAIETVDGGTTWGYVMKGRA